MTDVPRVSVTPSGEGFVGSVTSTTHRTEVTQDNKLVVYATGSNGVPVNTNIDGALTHESGLIVMTHRHWRVTQCEEYAAGSSFYEIPMNGSASVLFVTGSESAHFHLNGVADGDFRTAMMENANVSNSGASIGIINRRRDCVDTINSKLFVNPIISAAGSGDVICNSMFLGGSGIGTKFVSADVSAGEREADWILAAGLCYLFAFNNIAGRPATIVWKVGLHSHNHS